MDFGLIPIAEASVTTLMGSINRVIVNPIIKSNWGMSEDKTVSIETENGYTLYHTGNRQACVQVNGEDKRVKITFLINGETSSGYVEKEQLPLNASRTFCYAVEGEPEKVIVESVFTPDNYVNNRA